MPKVTKDRTAMIKRGNILCALRKERGINQAVVADHLGITQQAYLKYEHGDADPTIDALVKLSNFYDVSIDYLLGLSDVQTTFHHEKLEESLKNAYLSLPRNIRADILEAMVDAVISYQQGRVVEEATQITQTSSIQKKFAKDGDPSLIPDFEIENAIKNTEDVSPDYFED